MTLFLVENAIKINRMRSGGTQGPTEFGIINPYKQWPAAPKRLPFMDRPFGPGYSTLPEMSRPGFGPALGFIAARVSPVLVPAAIVGTSYVAADVTTTLYAELEPENPNEKRGFWYMLSGSMNTGLFD